jgi:hypothetical protein
MPKPTCGRANDPLTLLNLACIKYTGHSLPTSDGSFSNWKYSVALDEYVDEPTFNPPDHPKYARWSPHPYFNPLHLYYPSYDFGVRVLRSLLVDEIRFCKNPIDNTNRELIKSLANPFGVEGVSVKITLDFNSLPAKIGRMFHPDREPHQYPYFPNYGHNRGTQVKHHPTTEVLDEQILRSKLKTTSPPSWEWKYDIWTAKGMLRKKKETAEIIYNLKYLAIGMSYSADTYWFKNYNCSWYGILVQLKPNWLAHQSEWTYAGKNYYEWIKPIIDKEPQLEPEDWVRIFTPDKINKQEKINKTLIANFPTTITF